MNQETLQQRHYRYVIFAVCLMVTFINYLDRSIISFAIAPIELDLGLTNATFGFAISAFALGTLTVNGVAGVLVDRFAPRLVWPIAIIFWSLVMIFLGLAQSVFIFMILRYLLGVGEGINFPTMNRVLLNWVIPRYISTIMSYALLGVPLSNLIGSPILSHLIIDFNWRHSFMILGVSGALIVALWMIFLAGYRFPKAPYRDQVYHERHLIAQMQRDISIRTLLKNPALLSVCWSFFAFGYVLFFAISWLPGYLEQSYQMPLKQIGWFLMLPWGLASLFIVIGGFLSDYIMKKTKSSRYARIYLILICQIISIIFFIPPILIHSLNVATICISFAIAFALMPNAAFYSACSDITKSRAGTATGIMISFFSLSGILSPAVTGLLADWLGGFAAALGVLIFIILTSVLALWFYGNPDKYTLVSSKLK